MTKVLMIDDHRLFADAIRPALERQSMAVLPTAGTASEGMEVAGRERPDLVLVDIGLPDESGLSLGKRILDVLPDSRVVALTSFRDPKVLEQALRLGFHGYITKDADVSAFVSSVMAVLNGQVVTPKRMAKEGIAARSPEEREAAMLIEQLTPRELEVLTLLTEGATGTEIATRLSVSPNTVRTHIQNVLTKLQVHSRLEAAAFAVRHGVVRRLRAQGA